MMGAGLAMIFLGIVLLVAAIVLVVWVLFRIFPRRQEDPAEEMLRGRFARGEIDAEEYEKTLEVLRRERNTTKGGD